MILWPALLTVAVFVVFARRGSWELRLAPVLAIGGAHLVYNMWAITFASPNSATEQTITLWTSFLVFAAFAGFGARQPPSSQGLETSDTIPRPLWGATKLEVRSVRVFGAFATAAIVHVYLMLRAGGPPILAENANAARISFFPNGIYSTLVVVLLKASAMATGMVAVCTTRPKSTRLLMVCAASLLLLGATANRGLVVEPLLPILLFAAIRFDLRVKTLAAASIVLLLAFSAAGYQRDLAAYGPDHRERAHELGLYGPAESLFPLINYVGGTSSTFDRTIEVFPEWVDFQMGRQFFGPLLLNESADLYLKRVFGLEFEGFGLALGAMNAFYLDWGYVGVLVGFAVGGFLAGAIYRRAMVSGGLWVPAYLMLLSSMVLANYGHPFAYFATLATPLGALLLLRSAGDNQTLGDHDRVRIKALT